MFGIIIDTFGEMRDEALDRQEKLSSTCLVCLNTKAEVEDAHKEWSTHKEVEHDLWLYVYYIKYLKARDKTDYTPDEFAVYKSYKNEDTDWMPIGETIFLKKEDKNIDDEEEEEDEEEEPETTLEDQIDRLEKKISGMDNNWKEMRKDMKEIKKALKIGRVKNDTPR